MPVESTCECGTTRHVNEGVRFENARSLGYVKPAEPCPECWTWLSEEQLIPKVQGHG